MASSTNQRRVSFAACYQHVVPFRTLIAAWLYRAIDWLATVRNRRRPLPLCWRR